MVQSSVTEVETLQRKHTQFEEALDAQVDQLEQVEKLSQKMIQQKHYDSDNIRVKSRALATRFSPPVKHKLPLFGSNKVARDLKRY